MREWQALLWPWSESGTFYFGESGTFYFGATQSAPQEQQGAGFW
jgi:hypothetical protein